MDENKVYEVILKMTEFYFEPAALCDQCPAYNFCNTTELYRLDESSRPWDDVCIPTILTWAAEELGVTIDVFRSRKQSS